MLFYMSTPLRMHYRIHVTKNNKLFCHVTWPSKPSCYINYGSMFFKKLVEIFQQANSSKSILGKVSLSRQQCAQFIVEERLHHTKSDGNIVVLTREFSKLQFPKRQIEAQFIHRSHDVNFLPCQMQLKQKIIR